MKKYDGAWEPKGYIGPRIEIKGKKIIILWKNSPVLETTFSESEQKDSTHFILKDKELRYTASSTPYGVVKDIYVKEDSITVVEEYPVTGESVDTYYRTANSRYGDVTIMDKMVLPVLKGRWERSGSESDMYFEFKKGSVEYGYGDSAMGKTDIITLKKNSDNTGKIYITDINPAKEGVGMFPEMILFNECIETYIPVCDAKPERLIFIKKTNK